jgi:imidazoleglycerol phosphate synthase glutamine amidotransferase subunit HisH
MASDRSDRLWMGNLRSVAKALEHVAPASTVVIAQDAAAVAAQTVWFSRAGRDARLHRRI